jgi:methyl-accepting chemotaxis protein
MMEFKKLKSHISGRLFLTAAVTITIIIFILSAVSITAGILSVGELRKDVSDSLTVSQQEVQKSLEQSLTAVNVSVVEMEKNIEQSLADYLETSLDEELATTQNTLNASLLETANAMTDMLAEVSVESILGKKFSSLVSFVKVANNNTRVVYAVFFNKDGRPLTRYVNRSNPKVKALLSQAQGRTPMDKLLAAAANEKTIQDVQKDITFEGKVIGSVRVGITQEHISKQITDMQNRYKTLISSAKIKTQDVLNAASDNMVSKLASSIEAINLDNRILLNKTEGAIGTTSDDLAITQILVMLVAGVLVLVLICGFILFKLLIPVNILTHTMTDMAIGKADLTKRLPVKGDSEIDKLAGAFNQFVGRIQTTVKSTGDSTEGLVSSATQLMLIAEQESEHISKQHGEVQQIASAITEMASTVREVSISGESASFNANEAFKEAENGKLIVIETVEAITIVAKEVDSASMVINKLREDSHAIGSVLDVIRSIAEQTNLLALNAAIEAARAGDQGRGFAVVADEVRTLAGRTQCSTQEIQVIIQNLQESTDQAARVMNKGVEAAEQAVDTAKRAGNSISSIVGSVSAISDVNIQIATAVEEQSAVASHIDRSITSIANLSDKSSSEAEKTLKSCKDLIRLGEDLRELVLQFKV